MATNIENNKKRIAKNTLLLYLRMIVILLVNLYTSRIVLNSLGFSDYGIYNVVGGVVTMLQFLNVGMSGASQRFIAYEIGRNDITSLKKTFCTSIITHYVIAITAVIIMESIGVWFLNCKLNIPSNRLFAANCVFQCSIVTFVFSVISVPYNACIIAYEKMGAFAYISIFEALSKLLIAYAIVMSSYDKLILYAILIMLVQAVIRFVYVLYCKRHFEACSYKFHFDKKQFKEMFSFAGWGCIGNMGFSTKDQLSNILLNLFFGTSLNAARGIAGQISGIVSSFATNFTMAMNPQITKLYAAGEIEKSRDLTYDGSKYAFLLLAVIAIPFLTNEHYLLTLWLGDIPPYADAFVFIILIGAMIYSMAHTTATAILATGNIKKLQIGLAIILLSEVPLTYIFFKCGSNPWQGMLPSIFTIFISVLFRFYLITKYVPIYSFCYFIKNTVFRCFCVFLICIVISYYIRTLFPQGFRYFVLTSGFAFIITVFFSFLIGLTRMEKKTIVRKIKQKSYKK